MRSSKIALVLGAVVWLSFSAAPAARADDGGLLGDTAQVVGDAVEVVDPMVQTVQSTAPQPLHQPGAPAVPPPLAPVTNEVTGHVAAAEREAERTVEAAVRVAERAVQPVVRNIEPVGRQADEPAADAVEPAASTSRTPTAPEAAVVPGTPSSPADDVSEDRAQPVAAGTNNLRGAQHHQRSAQRPRAVDTTQGLVAAPRHIVRSGDDHPHDQPLWTLTNQLMHMWAGDHAPNGVDAGLVGDEDPVPPTSAAFDIVPLLSGLALGIMAMALARRGRRAGGADDRSHWVRAIVDHHVTARPSR